MAAAYPVVWGQLLTGWLSHDVGRNPLVSAGMLVHTSLAQHSAMRMRVGSPSNAKRRAPSRSDQRTFGATTRRPWRSRPNMALGRVVQAMPAARCQSVQLGCRCAGHKQCCSAAGGRCSDEMLTETHGAATIHEHEATNEQHSGEPRRFRLAHGEPAAWAGLRPNRGCDDPHTIRFADGSWQAFGDVEGQTGEMGDLRITAIDAES